MDASGMVLSCPCANKRGDVTLDALPDEDCDDFRRPALGLLRLLAEFATNEVLFFGGFCAGSFSTLGVGEVGRRVACVAPAAAPDDADDGSSAASEGHGDPSEPHRSPMELSNGGEITRAVLGS